MRINEWLNKWVIERGSREINERMRNVEVMTKLIKGINAQ